MKFRPCIDIHNGKVKQIVGGSLLDKGNLAKENFVSEQGADFYGRLYKSMGLDGGHVILLNPAGTELYEEDKHQAALALKAFPNGLQIGGGINADNAEEFIKMGASHVIVTSYVFKDGRISLENLNRLVKAVGKSRLVLDLSCRKRDGEYYIVTDRWQKFTNVKFDEKCLDELSGYCDEFLVHAVDVEGKARGIEENAAEILGRFGKCPCTYAGGISSLDDLETLKRLGNDRVDFTVGSALDIFGGSLDINEVAAFGR